MWPFKKKTLEFSVDESMIMVLPLGDRVVVTVPAKCTLPANDDLFKETGKGVNYLLKNMAGLLKGWESDAKFTGIDPTTKLMEFGVILTGPEGLPKDEAEHDAKVIIKAFIKSANDASKEHGWGVKSAP